MSKAKGLAQFREALTGRWQASMLIVGLAVLAVGVARIILSHSPLTYDEQLATIEELRSAGRFERANAYIAHLLKDEERPADQRAELHRRLAAVIHQAEVRLSFHSTVNARAIILNYQTATRLGLAFDASDWQRLGEAYDWAGQEEDAVGAYRACLQTGGGPLRSEQIHRRIVELRTTPAGALPDDAVEELDAILEDPQSSAEMEAWALERKVDYLLDRNEAPVARRLVEEARVRQGPQRERENNYLLARCLAHDGSDEAAERLLRAAMNESEDRDDLWSRMALLLGRIRQRANQPEEALAFFDEAIRTMPVGEIRDACALGRAEGLGMLGRYPAALAAFVELKDPLSRAKRHRYVGREVLRASMTSLSEALMQDPKAEEVDRRLAPRFLAMALDLTGDGEVAVRNSYLLRLAGAYAGLARRGPIPGKSEDGAVIREFHERAGDFYLALARQSEGDEQAYGEATWNAAQSFEAAGKSDRMIVLLAGFVRREATSQYRLPALHALGRAYQARREWANAVAAYGQAIDRYSPLPDALASMTPMAQCLIAQGGAAARRGVELLKDIVDDRTPQSLFTPQAHEFREALVTLATYYATADPQIEPEGHERAIERLEDALAFYPSDPRGPGLRFHLAEAYRRSAKALRASAAKAPEGPIRAAHESERTRRLIAAHRHHEEVRAALGGIDENQLSAEERVQLESSYLFAADCLYDLGDFEKALESYETVAWRYQATPTALMASLQIAQCHQRLGRMDEARAAVRRLAWLVRTIPADAFLASRGMPRKDYWERMIDRMDRMGTELAMN